MERPFRAFPVHKDVLNVIKERRIRPIRASGPFL
jgi:hypothetical protein